MKTSTLIRSLPLATALVSIAAALSLVLPVPVLAAGSVQQVVVSAKRMSADERRAYDAGVADGRRSVQQAQAEPPVQRIEIIGQRLRSERVAADSHDAARTERL